MLLGRELRSVTTYEYDDTGRLVRSVTVHESPWTEEDLGWAKAHQQNLDDRCPGPCGLPLSETTAMANGEPVHSYEVELPMRCQACDELAKKQEAHGESGQVIRPQALLWTVRRTD